jgi:hypothetical protein
VINHRSREALLSWATAERATVDARAKAIATDPIDAARTLLRAADPIAALRNDPVWVAVAWGRGAQHGRQRDRSRVALAYLVAAGVLAPSRVGRPRRREP